MNESDSGLALQSSLQCDSTRFILGSIAGQAGPSSKSGADLTLTMTDSPDPGLVGDNLSYRIFVKNLGPTAANGVAVTDTLPDKVVFVSSRSSQGNWATVEITVRTTQDGVLTNTATVSGDQSDPKAEKNSATAPTTVTGPPAEADLSVTKSDSPDPATVGSDLTYTIVAANAGPSEATGVTVIDDLPAGVEIRSISSTQGSCTADANRMTCSLGELAKRGSATTKIVVRPSSACDLSGRGGLRHGARRRVGEAKLA